MKNRTQAAVPIDAPALEAVWRRDEPTVELTVELTTDLVVADVVEWPLAEETGCGASVEFAGYADDVDWGSFVAKVSFDALVTGAVVDVSFVGLTTENITGE